jgi:hypothetical protein
MSSETSVFVLLDTERQKPMETNFVDWSFWEYTAADILIIK